MVGVTNRHSYQRRFLFTSLCCHLAHDRSWSTRAKTRRYARGALLAHVESTSQHAQCHRVCSVKTAGLSRDNSSFTMRQPWLQQQRLVRSEPGHVDETGAKRMRVGAAVSTMGIPNWEWECGDLKKRAPFASSADCWILVPRCLCRYSGSLRGRGSPLLFALHAALRLHLA